MYTKKERYRREKMKKHFRLGCYTCKYRIFRLFLYFVINRSSSFILVSGKVVVFVFGGQQSSSHKRKSLSSFPFFVPLPLLLSPRAREPSSKESYNKMTTTTIFPKYYLGRTKVKVRVSV